MKAMGITDDDRRALDQLLQAQSLRSGFPIRADELLERWRKFVLEVDHGYPDSIYEYTNELSARDVIEAVLMRAPEGLRQRISALVRPVDDEFLRATQPSVRPLRADTGGGLGPWWFRIPRRLNAEMESDLKSEAFL
jgi:hypothetical protein